MFDCDILCDLVRHRTSLYYFHKYIIHIGISGAALQIIAEFAICVRADRTSCAVLENDLWTLAGCVENGIPFLDCLNFF